MPLDVEPVDPFTVRDHPTLRGLQVFVDKSRVRQATTDDVDAGASLYRSHFATCTEPARFRR